MSTNTPTPIPPVAPGKLELLIVRTFDAPRELVWKAWTDPEQAAQWMGPRGYTGTDLEGELRPGGAWRACLRPDDGGEPLWQGGVYREVVEPERLVWTFHWVGDDGLPEHEMLITMTLTEKAGGTEMSFHQAEFASIDSRDGHNGGWNSTFDRLAEYLAKS